MYFKVGFDSDELFFLIFQREQLQYRKKCEIKTSLNFKEMLLSNSYKQPALTTQQAIYLKDIFKTHYVKSVRIWSYSDRIIWKIRTRNKYIYI